MKIIHHVVFFLWVVSGIQSSLGATHTNFYTRCKHGLNYYINGKKCRYEDKKAVWQAGTGLLFSSLAIVGFIQRERITSLFVSGSKRKERRGEELVEQKKLPQEVISDHPMIHALQEKDIREIAKLTKDPKNLNITYYGRPLIEEAISFAMEAPEDVDRMTIVTMLLNHGARNYDFGKKAETYIALMNIRASHYTDTERAENKTTLETLRQINQLWNSAPHPR